MRGIFSLYQNRLHKFGLLFFCTVFCYYSALSQQVCSEKLSKAEDEFDEGHLYTIPNLLSDCLERGFTKEEKIRAYRLLTITYLYLDRLEKADQSYLQLLRLNPEFEPNDQIDPLDLFYFHDQYITTPVFSINVLRIGTNFSYVNVINNYNADGIQDNWGVFFPDELESDSRNYDRNYASSAGFHLGTGLEYGINKNFSIGADLLISLKSFQFREQLLGGVADISFDENQWWVNTPLFLKFNFPNVKYKPYILGGFSLDFLFFSTASNLNAIWRRETQGGDQEISPTTGANLQIQDKRGFFNYSVLAGAGIKRKIGVNYLSFEVRYTSGLTNLSDTKDKFPSGDYEGIPGFNDEEAIFYNYNYVDNDFSLNNLSFLINYTKPIYKPRKKRRSR